MSSKVAAGKQSIIKPSNESKKPVQAPSAIQTPLVRKSDPIDIIQRVRKNPDSLTRDDVTQLQSTIGNKAVIKLLSELKNNKKSQKDEKPVQAKMGTAGKAQSSGKGKTGIPEKLKAGLETLSGVGLSDVRVHHNSDKPQQLGALAYTQGNDIHIAPGQEKHLPHEGWHAVQQKQGIVKPTTQMKTGEHVNDDTGLEKEADVMGNRAAKESIQGSAVQLKKDSQIQFRQDEGNVIQRITQEEAMALSKQNTQKKVVEDGIEKASYGETSSNVKKIQEVLKRINYWVGSSSDKSTGYFGDATRDSLISFQTGYMKLQKKDLYDKNRNYIGCGSKTAESLNSVYKLLNNSNVPQDAKNSIMGVGKSAAYNAAYSWNIKAGEYNGYVKEAQEKLIALGYELPKSGADGKWGSRGETYNALMKFQEMCKNTWNGAKQNAGAENQKEVEHFQWVEPTGKLDEWTYKALGIQVDQKLNADIKEAEKTKEPDKGKSNPGTGWNSTTPPFAKYGIPTIPSSGDLMNIVLSTISGSATGTIAGNANKVKKPLTASLNERGTYQQAAEGSIETYTPKINKTVAKVGNIAGKTIAITTLTLDVANTWTADSGNTIGQRSEKTVVQGMSAVASTGLGYVSGTIAAAGFATSEIGIGIPIIGGAVALDATGAAVIDWAQNKIYKALKIK